MYFFLFKCSVRTHKEQRRNQTQEVCMWKTSVKRESKIGKLSNLLACFLFFFIDGLRKEVNARGNEREWNTNVCFLANCCVCAVHWYSWPWVPRQMSGSNDIGQPVDFKHSYPWLVRIVWLSSNLDLSCTNCCTLSVKSYFFFRVNGFLWSNIFLTILSSVQ